MGTSNDHIGKNSREFRPVERSDRS